MGVLPARLPTEGRRIARRRLRLLAQGSRPRPPLCPARGGCWRDRADELQVGSRFVYDGVVWTVTARNEVVQDLSMVALSMVDQCTAALFTAALFTVALFTEGLFMEVRSMEGLFMEDLFVETAVPWDY